MNHSRRELIKAGSVLVGGMMFPYALDARYFRSTDDMLRIGVIGVKGMGWSNARVALEIPNTEIVGICDVDQSVIDQRLKEYAEMRSNTPMTYGDYRALLDDDSIDIVIIGTPDHWHCKMFCDAIDAGKHIYVEKPIALTIEECNLMINAARKRPDLMVQVGQWQRSGPHYRKAIEIVDSGVLGQIRLVKAWAYQGWMKPVPVLADQLPPDGVDYKMWLGPAPDRPFNENRFHFNFRWFWDYAGGLMTDWGVHEIDIALYAMKALAPKSVMASGGKLAYPNDASETPDTLQAIFEYNDFNMLWEHATGIDNGPYGRREGIAFIGNNGTLVVNRQGFEVLVEEGESKMEPIEAFERPKDVNYLFLHWQNFVEAIEKGDAGILNTPLESGSVAAINAMMGNIAYHTGRKIYWNQETMNFGDDTEANALMSKKYYNGWKKPLI